MIKIYGLTTCPFCDFIKPQIEGKEDKFQYIEIGSHVRNMHEFMDLRDSRPEFDECKQTGRIGIPAFLLEDGSVTLEPEDVGLVKFNGKKGC